MTSPWILGSRARDLAYLVVPGFVGVLAAALLPPETTALTVYAFFVTAFVDSGHVYTTLLRTYAHSDERRSWFYKAIPPGVAILFAGWFLLGIGGIWSFVVYATAFHHIRQFYGVCRWYQKLEGNFRPASARFLYTLMCLPLVAYHFRVGAKGEFYSDHDLWLMPNDRVFQGLRLTFAAVFAMWVATELRLYAKQNRVEWGRVLSIGGPAVLYAATFFWGTTPVEVLLPLMLAHGLGYFAMMATALVRTRPSAYATWGTALKWVLIVAVILGAVGGVAENYAVDFDSNYPNRARSLGEALTIGLYLIPLFTHFIVDAIIWRGKHREARLIYAAEKVAATPSPQEYAA